MYRGELNIVVVENMIVSPHGQWTRNNFLFKGGLTVRLGHADIYHAILYFRFSNLTHNVTTF